MICTYWLSGRAGREIFGSRINVRTEHSEIRALWSWAIQFPFQPELTQSRNFLSHDYPSFFNFFSSSARISRGLAAFSISCGPQTGIFILKFSIKARGVMQVIRWLKLWYLNTFGRDKISFDGCLCISGESPYKCTQCSRAFVRSTDLQRHLRNHTGEKPYKCQECSRAFARSTDLKRHMRTHTGEKPYKCWQCSKAFSQSGSLQTHLHTHYKESLQMKGVIPEKTKRT